MPELSRPNTPTLDEFLAMEGSIEEMTGDGLLMTGKTDIEKSTSAVVAMTRSMARVDIESLEKGVQVQKVIIHNLADKGYVMDRENIATAASAARFDFIKEYTDAPVENKSETLLYILEQTNDSLFVEVTITFGGGLHLLKAALPVGDTPKRGSHPENSREGCRNATRYRK